MSRHLICSNGRTLQLGAGLALCLLPALAPAQEAASPAPAGGWQVSGPGAAAFDVTTVSPGACGPRAGRIASNAVQAVGPVAVLQSFRAEPYRGARIRFSAIVDARDLEGWAGLVLHVEDAGGRPLLFDDQSGRPVRGTLPCARLTTVFEVPPEAEVLSLGLSLDGRGRLEFTGFQLERVGPEVPLSVGPRASQGRVGEVVFTDRALSGTSRAGRPVRVVRKAPGVWGDETGETSVEVDGDRLLARTVELKARQDQFGNRPLGTALEGDFQLFHQDGTTTIEGSWGGPLRQPVRVLLSPTRLELRWGDLERRLEVETGREVPAGCRSYAAGATADRVLVCGSVLGASPPPAQTVLAFLLEGFRRPEPGAPLPLPVPRIR